MQRDGIASIERGGQIARDAHAIANADCMSGALTWSGALEVRVRLGSAIFAASRLAVDRFDRHAKDPALRSTRPLHVDHVETMYFRNAGGYVPYGGEFARVALYRYRFCG